MAKREQNKYVDLTVFDGKFNLPGPDKVRDQNDHPPNPRVPTWVDLWARGADVDVTIFDDASIQMSIEQGRAVVIEKGLKLAQDRNDAPTFSDFTEKLLLGRVIVEYYGQKPSNGTRRFGQSDRDQIHEDDPNYYNHNRA